MERRENQTPQGKVAGVLVEFLEVAITSIVFLKGVYPSGAFERRRYMNVVVQRACHPQLRYYIHATVSGLLPFIQKAISCCWCHIVAPSIDTVKAMVERVAVIFFNADNVPLEKFVFKLGMNLSYGSAVEEVDLQFSLRSFMSKLSISESLTKKLPPGKYKV
ncbi:hypothetical protein TSUD_56210 [Trifolium subterraneum]|uniref:HORMA domain-containing protein n=1 Tax=Trifolium subterraneum TaxID=3900 RepID=A0A2Z6M8A5_TRISU|nr:hypothetical protein TSUD_56210 [Trifolium subterraneum]